jgi:hypothetical protein
MTLAQFKRSLSRPKPPAGLAPALAALWWAGKDEWDKAHGIVMNEEGKACAWVHAYLHRVEGDLGNARYWYRQAGKSAASGALDAEWASIVQATLPSE